MKVREPPSAPAVAEAATEVSLEVAARAPQVALSCNVFAADSSAWNLVLRPWYAVTAVWVLVSLVFRFVCGCASICISWLMIVLVSSPLTRPLTLVVDVAMLSTSFSLVVRVVRSFCYCLELLIPGRETRPGISRTMALLAQPLSRDRTFCGTALACASIAVPA